MNYVRDLKHKIMLALSYIEIELIIVLSLSCVRQKSAYFEACEMRAERIK
jgi:hypothetical protein